MYHNKKTVNKYLIDGCNSFNLSFMFWKLSGLDRNSFIIELKILIDFNDNELSWLDGIFDAKIGENTVLKI